MTEGLLTNEKHVWTDKEGKKLTFKQFMSRWKEGMQSVTPLQQVKAQLPGQILILIGVLLGLYVAFMNKTWWLIIVLVGVVLVNSLTLLSTWQKYSLLKKIDDELKEQMAEVNNDGQV